MNPVVRAQMNDFAEKNGIERNTDATKFELYSIYSVVNGMLHENANPFDLHLTGNEFGIDGVGIVANNDFAIDVDSAQALTDSLGDGQVRFIFVQSKTSAKFDYGDISKFFDAVCGFFEGTMSGESQQLDELISAKDHIYQKSHRRNPNIFCYFNSTGNYERPQRIESLIEATKTKLSDLNIFDEIQIRIVGAGELQNAYRAATSSNSSEIEFPDQKTLPFHEEVEEAYLGYVCGSQLLKIATNSESNDEKITINPSVFFDNVRDFNVESDINKQIVSEIEYGDKSAFVFRNNGVTVVAKNINRTGDKFLIEDYQIVNGCQTTNILLKCQRHASNLHVPFRLIGTKDDDFITSIIVGTNSQNLVKDEQF